MPSGYPGHTKNSESSSIAATLTEAPSFLFTAAIAVSVSVIYESEAWVVPW